MYTASWLCIAQLGVFFFVLIYLCVFQCKPNLNYTYKRDLHLNNKHIP